MKYLVKRLIFISIDLPKPEYHYGNLYGKLILPYKLIPQKCQKLLYHLQIQK